MGKKQVMQATKLDDDALTTSDQQTTAITTTTATTATTTTAPATTTITQPPPRPKRTPRVIIEEYGFSKEFPPTLAQFIDQLRDDTERQQFIKQYRAMPIDSIWELEDTRQRVLKRFPRAFDDDLSDEDKGYVQLLFELESNTAIFSPSTISFVCFILAGVVIGMMYYFFLHKINLFPYVHLALFGFFNHEMRQELATFKYISSTYYIEHILPITQSIAPPPPLPGDKEEDHEFVLKLYEPTLYQVLQHPTLHHVYNAAENITTYQPPAVLHPQQSLQHRVEMAKLQAELEEQQQQQQQINQNTNKNNNSDEDNKLLGDTVDNEAVVDLTTAGKDEL